jgi:serine/threonine protein kinase
MSQLVSGAEYIHSLGVAHRDFKLENVLFDNDCLVKIIDFGCAKDFHKSVLKTKTGTENYMAPEIHA